MRYRWLWAVLGVSLALGPAPAPAGPVRPVFHEQAGDLVDQLAESLRGLAAHLDRGRGGVGLTAGRGPVGSGARPLISLALRHRDALALTADQVARLEDLRDAFTREAVRREAEVQIAELDLRAALARDPVDLARAETSIREAARLGAELRIARLRTLERGKAVLTAEQRARLDALVGDRGDAGGRM